MFEPETFDWHGIATIAVWVMTLFIQRAENRDTQSIHAKLDDRSIACAEINAEELPCSNASSGRTVSCAPND